MPPLPGSLAALLLLALALLLLLDVVPPASACPLEQSSTARRAAESLVFAWLESEFAVAKQDLLPACPLLPANDRYYRHESLKLPWGNRYKCRSCGKLFRNEFFVDRHVANRHANESRANDGVCMAAMCDFLPCSPAAEVLHHDVEHPRKSRAAQKCRTVLDQCFPRGAQFAAAHEALEAFLCDGKPRPAGGSGRAGGAGPILKRAWSWTLAGSVFVWYAYWFWSKRAAKGRGTGLKRIRLAAEQPAVAVAAKARRQQVSASSLPVVNSPV